MIDFGKSEIFKRQTTQGLNCRFNVNLTAFNLLQEIA
jgi:hypothetical protein